jgi:hypothetical protein
MKSRSTLKAFTALAILAVAAGVLWRLPLYLNADFLLWSDEAANQLTIKHLITYREPYFFYHGMRYQGLTEGLLSLIFVPLFGFGALAQKLSGTVVYFAFAALALRFLLPRIQDRATRVLLVAFAVIPTTHLYHASFMAYGGHLLNAFLGFSLFYCIFRAHERRATASWAFPLAVCGLIAIGVYTYRHFLAFYPALTLMMLLFRGDLPLRSKKSFRNILSVGGFALLWPMIGQKIGEHIQNSTYENVNSFMTFQKFTFTDLSQLPRRLGFLVLELWPTLFATPIQDQLRWVGITLGLLALAAMVALFGWKLRDDSDIWKLYRVSCLHIAAVLASVAITPYAFLPNDVRYLMPAYAVAPFLAWAALRAIPVLAAQSMLAAAIVFCAFNTVAFNQYLGVQDGWAIARPETGYSDLVQYLDQEHIQCLYMDYTDAYRLSLLTQERIRASSIHLPRIRRYEECAAGSHPRIIALSALTGDPKVISKILEGTHDRANLSYRVKKILPRFTVLESY